MKRPLTQPTTTTKDLGRRGKMVLGRRSLLAVFPGGLLASRIGGRTLKASQKPSSPTSNSIKTREGEELPVVLQPLDREIWEEELSAFVPQRIFDAHCHLYRREFDLNYRAAQNSGTDFTTETVWRDCDLEEVQKAESVVMPGRKITRLAFAFPFRRCDFEKSNQFIANQVDEEPGSAALMLVEPGMSAAQVEKTILRHRFLGFKPYRSYCVNPECRITDFLPEHQIAIADRYGLLIMLHVGMKKSFGDERNLNDMLRLAEKFPHAKWILAHGARSFAPFPIEKAAPKLRGIPNIWYEVSAVCAMESFDALFSGVEIDRILYGADSGDVAFQRGKIVFYGRSWGDLTPRTNNLGGQLTFYLYEQLQAMRKAALRIGLTRKQIEDIFFTTGDRLVGSVAEKMKSAPRV